MAITRWDPFRDIVALQNRMNSVFEDYNRREAQADFACRSQQNAAAAEEALEEVAKATGAGEGVEDGARDRLRRVGDEAFPIAGFAAAFGQAAWRTRRRDCRAQAAAFTDIANAPGLALASRTPAGGLALADQFAVAASER